METERIAIPPGLRRLERPRVHQYVAEQIRREITLHLISPGEALPPERELARILGVSRKTVREAVAELIADGLIESRRGRNGGNYILPGAQPKVPMKDRLKRIRLRRGVIEEALTFRLDLEPLAARRAALVHSPSDLEQIIRAAEAACHPEDHAQFVEHDIGFHVAVAHSTQNRFYLSNIERVLLTLNDILTVLPESPVWHERSFAEYGPIIGAIEARDGESAQRAMLTHIAENDRSMRFFLAAL